MLQRISGTAEKRDTGLVNSVRMGGFRRLKENWSEITMINVRQHFEKVCLAISL